MKKFLGVLFFVLAMVTWVSAQGTPAASGTGYAWDSKLYTGAVCHAANDTVSGTSDSILILDTTSFAKGKFYTLVVVPFTGVDSVDIDIYVDQYSWTGVLLKRTLIDSLQAQQAGERALPINRTMSAATKYRIMGKASGKNGSTSIWRGGYVNTVVPAVPSTKSSYNN